MQGGLFIVNLKLSKADYEYLEQARNTLNVILAKCEMQETKKSKPKNNNKAVEIKGCKEILLSYGIFTSQEIKKNKENLKVFENLYELLGDESFRKIVARVYEQSLKTDIKNIVGYTRTSLEKEVKKQKSA